MCKKLNHSLLAEKGLPAVPRGVDGRKSVVVRSHAGREDLTVCLSSLPMHGNLTLPDPSVMSSSG